MGISEECLLSTLDRFIVRWKKEELPWKDFAYGFVLCMECVDITDFETGWQILKERGIL